MKKHFWALFILLTAVVAFGAYRVEMIRKSQDFFCRLEGIQCEACRVGITEELKSSAGVRSVRFGGQDRKDLTVTYTPQCSEEYIRAVLITQGYDLSNEGRSRFGSRSKCACPGAASGRLFR